MTRVGNSDWRNLPMPAVFDADFKAWIKSLSRQARAGEPVMTWSDLGPFAVTAYGLHSDLASSYCFAVSKKKAPTVLPDDCTPQGFYLKAVATRRKQIGIDEPCVPTPYERLSAFSQFLYRRIADRLAVSAGFSTSTSRGSTLDDGLGDDLDDGLGEPESDDDGLGGADVPDDLDDGLGGLALTADDGLGGGDGLGDGL